MPHQDLRIFLQVYIYIYVRIQLQGMGLEPHIGSMGFRWGVYKAFGSPIIKASFCDVVLQRFLSIGIRTFHHVSQLQSSGAGGDAGIAVFAPG